MFHVFFFNFIFQFNLSTVFGKFYDYHRGMMLEQKVKKQYY
jgi:hypothetical protein